MNNMKETGIPWLPEVSEDFSVGYVKQYFYVSKDLSNEGEPERVLKLARAGIVEKDVTTNEGQMAASYAGYNKVQVGDLLLNPMDLYSGANCNVSELNGVISPAYSNLRAKKAGSVVPKFYGYYFKSQYWLMAMFAHGKGVSFDNRWTLNNDSLRAYEIPVTPYAVQQRIVERIQSDERKVDTLIANVQAQIEKLKTYKQSLITEVVTKGFDPNVPMKDSGVDYLGRIPSGWSIISIGQAFTYVGGFAFKSELFTTDETQYQVLRIGNVKNDNLILDNKQIYVDGACAESAKVAEVHIDDILFTMTGTKGKRDYFYTLLVNENHTSDRHLFINQRVGLFRAKSSKIKMAFANYVLKEKRILDYIFLSETGTANQGNIGIENIARTKLYLPSLAEQEQIVSYLDEKCSQIDRLIALKEEKIEKLEQYKRSLIYEYVTGKREVI